MPTVVGVVVVAGTDGLVDVAVVTGAAGTDDLVDVAVVVTAGFAAAKLVVVAGFAAVVDEAVWIN